MSKCPAAWLLAICLCIPLAACAMVDDGEPGDPGESGEAAEPDSEAAAIEAQSCEFSVQCDPCQPPWVQQTAQRTWDSCGASGPMWAIEYYCALCTVAPAGEAGR